MFVFLLTTATGYDIIQEYRHVSYLHSFAVHLFYVWRTPLREEGRITRLRRGVVCSEVAAQEKRRGGSQPEPSERRAITGLYKHTLFLGTKPRLR